MDSKLSDQISDRLNQKTFGGAGMDACAVQPGMAQGASEWKGLSNLPAHRAKQGRFAVATVICGLASFTYVNTQ